MSASPDTDVRDLPIRQVGALLRARTMSAEELMRLHLDRIDERNASLHAFVHVDREGALRAAATADRELAAGTDRGPLHGIPIAIKDLIDTAGVPTSYGSALYRDHVPAADAAVVIRLQTAGAIVVGKVHTYEFATVGPEFGGPHPPARNPWNPARITGGSSSGSAAAVSGGLVRTSVGTDTGGSVRSPASFCGVVGLKPTYGALPLAGVFPLSPSLDHVGVLGANVEDTATTYSALAQISLASLLDPAAVPAGLTVGYARNWFAHDDALDPALLPLIDDVAQRAAEAGVGLREVELPEYPQFEEAAAQILRFESFGIHRDALRARGSEYGTRARNSLLDGERVSADDVETARTRQQSLTRQVDAVLGGVDVIMTATTLGPAPAVADFLGDAPLWTPMRTIPFNLTGHPALSLPVSIVGGMPVAVQLLGRRGDEGTLLRLAALIEALGFGAGLPDVWRG